MKKLIVNADDFGLSRAVTDAIIDCHLNGIVTSTTIMVNTPAFEYSVLKAKELAELGIGLHINLTQGKPVSDVNDVFSLLNDKGEFLNNAEQRKNLMFFNPIKYKQLKKEISMQFQKAVDSGIRLTHFDSHHHITGLPSSSLAAIYAAKLFNVNKARITSIKLWNVSNNTMIFNQIKTFPKEFVHKFNKNVLIINGFKTPDFKILPSRVLPLDNDFNKQFIQALSVIPDGKTVEIALHPGYDDPDLMQKAEMVDIRKRDVNVSMNSEVIEYIKSNGIKLISYAEL